MAILSRGQEFLVHTATIKVRTIISSLAYKVVGAVVVYIVQNKRKTYLFSEKSNLTTYLASAAESSGSCGPSSRCATGCRLRSSSSSASGISSITLSAIPTTLLGGERPLESRTPAAAGDIEIPSSEDLGRKRKQLIVAAAKSFLGVPYPV
jgi:hypothetical protein